MLIELILLSWMEIHPEEFTKAAVYKPSPQVERIRVDRKRKVYRLYIPEEAEDGN